MTLDNLVRTLMALRLALDDAGLDHDDPEVLLPTGRPFVAVRLVARDGRPVVMLSRIADPEGRTAEVIASLVTEG